MQAPSTLRSFVFLDSAWLFGGGHGCLTGHDVCLGVIRRVLVSLLVVCSGLFSAGLSAADGREAGVPLLALNGKADAFLYSRVWLDHDKRADIREVAAHPERFAPPAGQGERVVNAGYNDAVVWIRVPVRVGGDAPHEWLLEVAYPTLDHVTLYRHEVSGQWRAVESGDLVPRSRRPFEHHNLVFPLALEPGAEEVLFLRVESQGNLTIPLVLWQPKDLLAADRSRYAWQALYFGALLALLSYNLMLFLAIRDPLYLTYSLMVLGMGSGLLTMKGFGSLLIWGDAVLLGNAAFPLSLALCGLAGALFTRRFLESRRRAPALDRVVLALTALFAVETLFGYWLPYALLARLVSATGLCFSVVAVVLALQSLIGGQRSARLFLAGWLLLLVGVGVTALRNFGWLPTNALTSNIMQIGSALEMLLLSLALADRINSLRQEKDLAHADAVRAERKLVDTLRDWGVSLEREVVRQTHELREANLRLAASEAVERRGREEQTHFIAMIAHDIRTPLAIIKAAVQSLQDMDLTPPPLEHKKRYDRIQRALQRLNALLEIALMQDRTNVDDWRMDMAEIHLEALTGELSQLLSPADEARLCCHLADGLPALRGDPRMLRVMLLNIVENALKYSPRDSQVYLKVETGDQAGEAGVFIRVIDHGPGIPPGQEERIFQKYYRSPDVAGQPGLGIGLFLARFICRRHGGILHVVVRPREAGACLEAWLPLERGGVS